MEYYNWINSSLFNRLSKKDIVLSLNFCNFSFVFKKNEVNNLLVFLYLSPGRNFPLHPEFMSWTSLKPKYYETNGVRESICKIIFTLIKLPIWSQLNLIEIWGKMWSLEKRTKDVISIKIKLHFYSAKK